MHTDFWSIFTVGAVLIQVIPFSVLVFLTMETEKE